MRVLTSRAAACTAVLLAAAACGGPAPSSTVGAAITSAGPTSASTAPVVAVGPTPAPSASAAPAMTALRLLWSGTAPSKQKAQTYWPAVNPKTGDIWVSETFDNQFWIFSPDGKFKEAWGTTGSGPGQFKLHTNDMNPDSGGAIAFAPDGSFYVTDTGNYRVQAFDAGRHFVRAWGGFGSGDGQFTSPKGIATDGKVVYVADDPGRMQVFDTGGSFIRSFDFPFVIFSLARDGRLLTSLGSGIGAFDGQGKQTLDVKLDGTGSWPAAWSGSMVADVVQGADGTLYAGVQDDSAPLGLIALDPAGRVRGEWSTGGETLALAPDGRSIYMAWSGPSNTGWTDLRTYALPTE